MTDIIARLERQWAALDPVDEYRADARDAIAEIAQLRGAQAAADERLANAAQRVGITAGCDAPEWMADEIERLRAELADATHNRDEFRRVVGVLRAELDAERQRRFDGNRIASEEARDESREQQGEIERLRALSVESILLDVTPGWDGMGHEVYANSVEQVERKLTDMGERLENAELERDRLRAELDAMKAQGSDAVNAAYAAMQTLHTARRLTLA